MNPSPLRSRPAGHRCIGRTPTVLGHVVLPIAMFVGAVVSGCSSAETEKPKTPGQFGQVEKRDTQVVHEPCDGSSAEAVKVDVNGDKKPDITHVMKAGKELCRILDLNLDGAIDAFIYYDDQGRERRRESDFDRDGRADEIAIYERGVLKLKMRETNFDNKIDTWDFYENDRLVRRERDSDGDGFIDQWWTFNNPQNPKCATVATDRNADGRPDPDSVVDLCGDSYGSPAKVAPGAPAASAAGSATGAPPAVPPPASAAPAQAVLAPSTVAPLAPSVPPVHAEPPALTPTKPQPKKK